MGFKKLSDYNEEKYEGRFVLRDDNDSADVVILYRSVDDVVEVDSHYIKSTDYNGYVCCTGRGCPACGKGIRIQPKLFIPVYDIKNDKVLFWDRTTRFEAQLNKEVLERYPNPSEYVFRITRHGAANSRDTSYTIMAIARNTAYPYDMIMKKFNYTFPDFFENICKDFPEDKLASLLSSSNTPASRGSYGSADLPDYAVTPRVNTEEIFGTKDSVADDEVSDELPEYSPETSEGVSFDDGELSDYEQIESEEGDMPF